LAILHSTAILRNIRAFNIAGGRDSYTAGQNYPGRFNDSTNAGPAPAGSAAVAGFSTATGRSIYHWIRGLPAALISNSPQTGFPTPPSSLTTPLAALGRNLGNNNAGSRTLSVPANSKYQITNVAANPAEGTSTISYTLGSGQVAQPWVNGSRVVIGLASKKDLPGMNGHWSLVLATTPAGSPAVGTVTIRYVLPNNAANVSCNGYIRPEGTSTVNQFTNGGLAYYGTHSTRSVFSNSRGSKHAARIRTLA
jgi:hypothetical protein